MKRSKTLRFSLTLGLATIWKKQADGCIQTPTYRQPLPTKPMLCRLKRTLALLIFFAAWAIVPLAQQSANDRAAWNRPFQPFHLIGNVYYVGAAGVSAFLIVTSSGSILLDGGLPETAPQIAQNIATLGFRLSDVKYLLNSHAHFDHAGGLAELKRLSGAAMVASKGDAPALRAGGPNMPGVAVDRIVEDGEALRLGDATLTAHVTPGHTQGCTTWTTTTSGEGRTYSVVFYCSTSVVDRLVGNIGYPQIATDYEDSFRKLRALSADVFLAPHPSFFDMENKRKQQMKAGKPNPFVDPAEFPRFVEKSAQQFRAELEARKRP
jgi:metallo-beta-lactamase class B